MTIVTHTPLAETIVSGPRTPQKVQRGSLKKIKDTVEYYEHQTTAVRELDKWQNFILADVMGLGKTLTAVTVAALDFERGITNRMLVVTLASLKQNFAEDLKRHTHFTWHVLTGDAKKRAKQLEEFSADVLIVNYEQVVTHWKQLNEMGFGITIYDEAHSIKGHKSQRTVACHHLTQPRHFVLTGSPILNQVDDAWALLHRVDPLQFPSYWRFVNRYAVYGGFKAKQIIGIKEEKELRQKVQSLMMRREEDVLGRTKPQPIVVKVDLTPLQRELYEQMREELRVEAPGIEEGELISVNAMVKMMRLKQIAGTTATIPGQPDESGKLDRAVAMCDELIKSGESVVVFTQFRPVLHAFEERLQAQKIKVYALHGDVPIDNRVPIVNRWGEETANGQPGVIVCMFQVGGVGLNMTAASKLILLDKDYAPEINKQAIARVDRIGQTKPVMVWDIQARNSIDTRITSINEQKSDVFNTLIATGNDSWKRRLVAAVLAEEEDE
jgi:SNF2 family DNA or RNA helicase